MTPTSSAPPGFGSTAVRPPRPSPPASRGVSAARRLAGRFRYDGRSGSWSWSPEMSALLGHGHGGAHPCIELLVRSLHPRDRTRTLEAIAAACSDGRPFAIRVRVCGRGGTHRTAVLVGEPVVGPAGSVAALEGLLVEVPPDTGRPTPPDTPAADDGDRVRALEAEVSQLRAAMGSRAAIEQAKGILMLLTGCGDQVAFDLLAHISSNCHRKVRDVAVAITESAAGQSALPDDVRTLLRDVCPPSPAGP